MDSFKFFKPKVIGFDLTEEEYTEKYDEYVRGKNFREVMKRIDADVSMRRFEDLQLLDFSAKELIFLLTFYHCYTAKCTVIFLDKSGEIQPGYMEKMERLKFNSSDVVRKLIDIDMGDIRPGELKDNEILVNELLKRVDRKTPVFKKPTDSTLFAVVGHGKMGDFEKWWRFKCRKMFEINVLDPKDPMLTDELEAAEFKKQLSKFG